jgi:hypothetical protein
MIDPRVSVKVQQRNEEPGKVINEERWFAPMIEPKKMRAG